MLQPSLVQGDPVISLNLLHRSVFFQESKGGMHLPFSSSHQVWAGLPLSLHPPPDSLARHCALARLAVRQADALLPHHRTRGAEKRAAARGDGGAEGETAGEREGRQGESEAEGLTEGGGGTEAGWRGAPFDAQP